MPPAHRRPIWAPKPEIPDPYTREAVAGLGLRELLVNEAAWVHRRVETFEFLDESTVRRKMSVDLTLPEDNRLVRALFALEGPFVPLTTLRKTPLGHLDVWTEDGRALPVLTTEQNGRLAGACLFGIARNFVRHGGTLDELTSRRPLLTLSGRWPCSRRMMLNIWPAASSAVVAN
jgi:hypothetical protein